jgi:hypothetical protein
MQVGTDCDDYTVFHEHVRRDLPVCIYNDSAVQQHRGADGSGELVERGHA